MTTPNPAPATRERELFDKLASDIYNRQGLGDEWQAIDDEVMNNELMPDWLAIFAAALARERREAQAEQMERDCKAVCEYCESGHEVRYKAWDMPVVYDFGHWAMDDESADFQWVKCEAHNIRAAAIEALRDGEKG